MESCEIKDCQKADRILLIFYATVKTTFELMETKNFCTFKIYAPNSCIKYALMFLTNSFSKCT